MADDVQAQAKWIPAMLAVAGVLGFALVLIATAPHGASVPPDGVVYLDAARNIAAGKGPVAHNAAGETEPLVTWPPLYPALIAPGVALGLEAQAVARWINAAAFGGFCVLMGLLAARVSRRREAAVIAALMLALSPTMLHYAGLALTEAVYLLLMAGTLLLALGPCRKCIAAAGVLAGLACMQRYAGYSLVAACALWLIWSKQPKRAALFAVCAAPLPLLWRVWVLASGAALDTREAAALGPTELHARSLAHSLATWLVPEAWPVAVRAGVALMILLAALAAVVWVIRRRNEATPALLLVVAAAAYSALLAVSIMFLDPSLQPEPRFVLVLLPFAAVGAAWQAARFKRAGWIAGAVLFATFAARDVAAINAHRAGLGYSAPEWRESDTLRAALELGDGPVYSNNPQPLILYGRRPARALAVPGIIEYIKPRGTPAYADVAAEASHQRATGLEGGYAVWFGEYAGELDGWGLTTVAVYDDGLILRRK